jgi:hypothetical protein
MRNLREAYYKPFAEEARGHFSAELKFKHEPVESGMSAAEHGNVMDIVDEERAVSLRSGSL